MSAKSKKIGVLMGGLSREREVSLRSGRAVAQALRSRGYAVVEIDADTDVALKLRQEGIDLAVIMLHGRWGEDGTIQGLLEVMKIPYTGSGPLPSALTMDKDLTKRMVRDFGILTADWKSLSRSEVSRTLTSPLALPVVVKPNREGSSFGVTRVTEASQFQPALKEAAQYDNLVLVEKMLTGKELTVGLIDGQALPVIEIVPKGGFYSYEAKYTKGMTDYIVPARIPEPTRKKLMADSEEIYRRLNLSGVARADYISDGEPYFTEVNTIPGMTETSLVPKAASAAGISFEELCERMVKGASLKI